MQCGKLWHPLSSWKSKPLSSNCKIKACWEENLFDMFVIFWWGQEIQNGDWWCFKMLLIYNFRRGGNVMEARLRGGYWGRQDLCTPVTDSGGGIAPLWDFRIASQEHLRERKPSSKQENIYFLKNFSLRHVFLFKSGFFCSKINLAPPLPKSCIPPVEPRLEDWSLRYRQEDLINVELCKNDPISL